MKLARVCSEFDKGRWKIHLFGYDENLKPVKKIAIWDDYFFYSKKHISDLATYNFRVEEGRSYPSLYGEDVCKVYYRSIKNKRALSREKPERIYE